MFRILILTFLITCKATAMVAIELRPSVEVEEAYPRLNKLAIIEGSAREVESFSKVASRRPILLGRTVKYSKEEVENWILDSGMDIAQLQWRGVNRVSVHRRSNLLSEEQIKHAITSKLSQKFRGKALDVSLNVSGMEEVQVPRGAYSLSIQLEQEQLRKKMSALVSITSGGSLVRKIRVKFDLKLIGTAVVATDNLASHTMLNSDFLATARVNLLSKRGEIATSKEDLLGKRLIRPVAKGQAISKNEVESVPAVIKSEAVDVVFVANGVSIKMKGIALEDGKVGEKIMVTLPTSETPMPVIVVGKEKGQIQNGV